LKCSGEKLKFAGEKKSIHLAVLDSQMSKKRFMALCDGPLGQLSSGKMQKSTSV
jgi:hypothetical protein